MSEQTFTFEEALNTVGTGIGLQNAIDLVRAAHSRALAAATEEMRRERDEARALNPTGAKVSLVPCKKCGAGPIVGCYGCKLKKAEAECARLREALDYHHQYSMTKAEECEAHECQAIVQARDAALKEPSRD
jgi:predicted TIM-barrel enzyme